MSITSAQQSHSTELRSREKRYLISMGIRTVCFLLAVIVPILELRIAFLIAAFVLPPVAVVIANAGARAEQGKLEDPGPPDRPMLETGPFQNDQS